MADPRAEAEQLKQALEWLRGHRKRLEIDRRSLEGELSKVRAEIERLDGEIAEAEARYQRLLGGPEDL